MPIIKMDKIIVVGLTSEKDAVIQALMNSGAVEIHEEISSGKEPHFIENESNIEIAKDNKNMEISSIESFPKVDNSAINSGSVLSKNQPIEQAELIMTQMKNAIENSRKFYKEKKPMFSSKRNISPKIFEQEIARKDEIIKDAMSLQSTISIIANLNAKITRTLIYLDQMLPWKSVPLELNKLETKNTIIFIGTIKDVVEYEKMQTVFKGEITEIHTEILNKSDDSMQIAIIVFKEKEDLARSLLKSIEFCPLIVSDSNGTPKDICSRYDNEIAFMKEQIATHETACLEISKNIVSFEILYDHAMILLQKALASNLLNKTRYTFLLYGWIPTHLVKEVEKGLQKEFCIALSHETATSDDDYPILLKNNPLVKPYEVITEMFSVPSSQDVDPNPVMAPFFLLFFSLMLSDAGYGALLAGGCALLIWKMKVKGNLRKMCLFMFQGGLVSIVWGLMFGGFFGDMLTVLSSGKISFPTLWFNPINDPIKLMVLSMIFGVIHIFTGMGTKAYILIVTGKWKDAVLDIFSWYIVIIGLAGMIVGVTLNVTIFGTVGKILALTGAAIIVLFGGRSSKNPIMRILKGLTGLYDITGYFSDILSYTRILALSLATGVIAMVVNMLGGIMGFNIFGIILFVVVGLLGHTLNLALSTLGCYVHTSRLQYVEFFGKFYGGGGRMWNPLEIKTKYTQIDIG